MRCAWTNSMDQCSATAHQEGRWVDADPWRPMCDDHAARISARRPMIHYMDCGVAGGLPHPVSACEGETRATPAACSPPDWHRMLSDRVVRFRRQGEPDGRLTAVRLDHLEKLTGEDCGPNACSREAEGGWVCQAELDREELQTIVTRQARLLLAARDREVTLLGQVSALLGESLRREADLLEALEKGTQGPQKREPMWFPDEP